MHSNKMGGSDGDRKGPQIEEAINPFVHRPELNRTYDRVKLIVMTVLVVPIRILGIIVTLLVAYALSFTGLYGLSQEEYNAKPLSGWRRKIRWYMGLTGRLMMFGYAFQWVTIKGRKASREEAPILVVGPHSSFFDCIAVFWSEVPCLVNRIENLQIPFFGKFLDYTQPVYVRREDQNSRQNTIAEIKRRATDPQDWPQVMIFPEGTCTNRTCLITFKPGAFYPGVPIQPVVIRYPNRNDTVTWTWDGPGAAKILWQTLCQIHNYCELEYLPVYHPNEEEKKDANLFANNVRKVMANALGVPVADYTFDDCRLMQKAKKWKLPAKTGLVEFQSIRHRLGLKSLTLKEVEDDLLSKYASIAKTSGQISLTNLAQYLALPQTEPELVAIFNLYDKNGTGLIDFKAYLIGHHQHSLPANTEDTWKWAWRLFDQGEDGQINLQQLTKTLNKSMNMNEQQSKLVFEKLDTSKRGYVTYEDFIAHAKQKPEYARIFLNYQESIKKGTRQEIVLAPGKTKAD